MWFDAGRACLDLENEADREILRLMSEGDAEGTSKTRSVVVRHWLKFCVAHGAEPLRVTRLSCEAPEAYALASELLVMRWCMMLINDRNCKVKTVESYLSLLRSWHEAETGLELCKGIRMARCRKMLRGLRRRRPSRKRVRKGLTRSMLLCFKKKTNTESKAGATAWAVAVLGFRRLLRSAEMACPPGAAFDSRRGLCRGDWRWPGEPGAPREHATLTILPLKKGPGQAKDLSMPCWDDRQQQLSMWSAMAGLQRWDPVASVEANTAPMFSNERGRPLTTTEVRAIARKVARVAGAQEREYGGHSFRIGGATALHGAGCPELAIKTMGRWSSDVYEIYTRAELGQMQKYDTLMADYSAVTAEDTLAGWVV